VDIRIFKNGISIYYMQYANKYIYDGYNIFREKSRDFKTSPLFFASGEISRDFERFREIRRDFERFREISRDFREIRIRSLPSPLLDRSRLQADIGHPWDNTAW